MKPNTPAVTSAHTALREAAAALAHGKNANRGGEPLSDVGRQLLAADLASNLEALATIMHTVGIEPVWASRSPTTREFRRLLQQVTDVAATARKAAGPAEHEDRGLVSATWSSEVTPDD